jgi:hypothetical protein
MDDVRVIDLGHNIYFCVEKLSDLASDGGFLNGFHGVAYVFFALVVASPDLAELTLAELFFLGVFPDDFAEWLHGFFRFDFYICVILQKIKI